MLDNRQFKELFPRADAATTAAFIADKDSLFEQFGLLGNLTRLHFFLAQIGHESGGLTITKERLSYSAKRMTEVWPSRFRTEAAAEPYARNPEGLANQVYASRMGNGPPESGDGWRYRGRGYIQITGKDAYAKVGGFTGLDLVNNPDDAFDPAKALLVACGVWQWKGLNERSDTGDFVKVTRRINGGTNGLADRRAWLDKVHRILGEGPNDAIVVDTSVIISVQQALQKNGFPEVGAADGIIGVRTLSAISRYRLRKGMLAGQIDKDLLESLRITEDALPELV